MANSVDSDETAENDQGLHYLPNWEGQLVWTLIRLLRMAISVDPDQAAENVNQCRPLSDCWERQTV